MKGTYCLWVCSLRKERFVNTSKYILLSFFSITVRSRHRLLPRDLCPFYSHKISQQSCHSFRSRFNSRNKSCPIFLGMVVARLTRTLRGLSHPNYAEKPRQRQHGKRILAKPSFELTVLALKTATRGSRARHSLDINKFQTCFRQDSDADEVTSRVCQENDISGYPAVVP